MGLRWYGDAVKRHVQEASERAIEGTVTDAAREAASMWPIDTGAAAASIEVLEHAEARGTRTSAIWGARALPASAAYTESSRHRVIFEEIGVRGRPGRSILRRTADALNVTLAGRLRREFRR